MRDDRPRTSALHRAIDNAAPGKTVLEIGTGALALLALRCARAGAAHVFAVEAEPEAAALAREAVAAAGLGDRITVIEGRSQDVELPRRAELLVHELIGEVASREGFAGALRDAVRRHLEPQSLRSGGWSVPKRAATWATPVTAPPKAWFLKESARSEAAAEASDALRMLLPGSAGPPLLRLPGFPVDACALAAAQPLEAFQFGDATESFDESALLRQVRHLQFRAEREGKLAGFALHITMDCGHGTQRVSSAVEGSSWAVRFVKASRREALQPGDVVELDADIDLEPEEPVYKLKAGVRREGERDAAEATIPVLGTAFQ